MQVLAIALGGAAGAVLRYGSSLGIHQLLGRGFPYGTLFVNVSGSLLMGILYVLLIERMALSPEWRAGMLVGLLGGFTTFSGFSVETLQLFEEGAFVRAAMNIILSVVLCLAAAWAGMISGRQL